MNLIDKIPVMQLAIGALLLGLAPFFPEPHLFEKLRMLFHGTLIEAIDIFDLLMHAALPILLIVKLLRMYFTA
ncbi:MAG: RND transporter [Alphaproteobacteria bacterium]|nr:RND transporter [Alphaproteobacteria bacterium]